MLYSHDKWPFLPFGTISKEKDIEIIIRSKNKLFQIVFFVFQEGTQMVGNI